MATATLDAPKVTARPAKRAPALKLPPVVQRPPAVTCPSPIKIPPTVKVDTKKLFDILTASWKSDMHAKASSNPYAILKNPAFQMTIALGPKVVPLIFKEYEREDDEWAIALAMILKFSPVKRKHYGRIADIRADWLKWGKKHGYL